MHTSFPHAPIFPVPNPRAAAFCKSAALACSAYRCLLCCAAEHGHKARAKSVIFLHQWGGPSCQDSFDMKPDAPDMIRGEV